MTEFCHFEQGNFGDRGKSSLMKEYHLLNFEFLKIHLK